MALMETSLLALAFFAATVLGALCMFIGLVYFGFVSVSKPGATSREQIDPPRSPEHPLTVKPPALSVETVQSALDATDPHEKPQPKPATSRGKYVPPHARGKKGQHSTECISSTKKPRYPGNEQDKLGEAAENPVSSWRRQLDELDTSNPHKSQEVSKEESISPHHTRTPPGFDRQTLATKSVDSSHLNTSADLPSEIGVVRFVNSSFGFILRNNVDLKRAQDKIREREQTRDADEPPPPTGAIYFNVDDVEHNVQLQRGDCVEYRVFQQPNRGHGKSKAKPKPKALKVTLVARKAAVNGRSLAEMTDLSRSLAGERHQESMVTESKAAAPAQPSVPVPVTAPIRSLEQHRVTQSVQKGELAWRRPRSDSHRRNSLPLSCLTPTSRAQLRGMLDTNELHTDAMAVEAVEQHLERADAVKQQSYKVLARHVCEEDAVPEDLPEDRVRNSSVGSLSMAEALMASTPLSRKRLSHLTPRNSFKRMEADMLVTSTEASAATGTLQKQRSCSTVESIVGFKGIDSAVNSSLTDGTSRLLSAHRRNSEPTLLLYGTEIEPSWEELRKQDYGYRLSGNAHACEANSSSDEEAPAAVYGNRLRVQSEGSHLRPHAVGQRKRETSPPVIVEEKSSKPATLSAAKLSPEVQAAEKKQSTPFASSTLRRRAVIM